MTTPRLPHDDLTAAMAARRELGPDYDDAFVEAIADRLRETLEVRPAPRPPAPDHDHSLAVVVLTLLAAVPLTAIGVVNAELPGLFIVWAGLALINLAYQFRPRR
jgi:hypothetical protein